MTRERSCPPASLSVALLAVLACLGCGGEVSDADAAHGSAEGTAEAASGSVVPERYEELVLADFRGLAKALNEYLTEEDAYPEGDLGSALRPYMSSVPLRDPQGIAYRYAPEIYSPSVLSPGENFTLRASGPDREHGTADDIVFSNGMRIDPTIDQPGITFEGE